MWWEAASTFHEYLWRIDADRPTPDMSELQRGDVLAALERLATAKVRMFHVDQSFIQDAWRVADRCGFARLYDAAYVALALQTQSTLVTLDAPLRRGPASRLVTILGPAEL